MKIRTGFVTNSSSSSYGVIVIDNPVLLEIFARYKVMGIFDYEQFEVGVPFPGYANYTKEGREFEPDTDIKTLTPAFFVLGEDICDPGFGPSTLDEVLDSLIKLIDENSQFGETTDDGLSVDELFQQMVKELKGKEKEIFKAYVTVKWNCMQNLYDGRFRWEEFQFDQENGEDYFAGGTGSMEY